MQTTTPPPLSRQDQLFDSLQKAKIQHILSLQFKCNLNFEITHADLFSSLEFPTLGIKPDVVGEYAHEREDRIGRVAKGEGSLQGSGIYQFTIGLTPPDYTSAFFYEALFLHRQFPTLTEFLTVCRGSQVIDPADNKVDGRGPGWDQLVPYFRSGMVCTYSTCDAERPHNALYLCRKVEP